MLFCWMLCGFCDRVRSKMAEESLILLDKKMLSMDLSAISEFALHVKVENLVVEGKGKVSVIRFIRRKIEDSVDVLTSDDQIDYVDGLMAHLAPLPLEGTEDKYGQEGLQNKSDLKKLKQELGDLETKQQLVEEKLAKMQKEKLIGTVKEEETIKFPVKELEQSIFRRDFKIQGVVGDPGRKENLGYQALISQIEAGLTKGYSDKEEVSAVVRAVQPGLQLRSYLETMVDLTLPRLRKFLRFHFHEKNTTELYQLLSNIAQQPNEDPQLFLMRALTVRQKIISASKESDSGIKYDASSVQSLFLHAVETGLADEIIRGKIRPLTQNPKVTDEDLIGAMSLAISAETEQSNKFNLASKGKSVKVSAIESAAESNTKKELQKDQQVLATLKAVEAELATMKAEVKNQREAASNQKADPMMPSHAENGVRTGARPLGCQECRRKREGDRCPHCYLCGGLYHIARYCQSRSRNYPGNAPRLPRGTGSSLARKREVAPV